MRFHVPLIIRGSVFNDADLDFKGRGDGVLFTTPDVKKHLDKLVLDRPSEMSDLYSLRFDDILDYLDALGGELCLQKNEYLQAALALSLHTSSLGEEMLRDFYKNLHRYFARGFVKELADNAIGIRYLEGWVERRMSNGCSCKVRAFGGRSVHVLAGNVPLPSAMGVVRNAITRSDAIFKVPSNDPMTAPAIAQTMIRMAPFHPLTRHLSVAYWKGGDGDVEDRLYRPDHVEKIIAWGGLASIQHISKYVQPGIDLITLDPKLSSSIVGREAFLSEETMREAAERLAIDIGTFNQQGCTNARVIYVETGTQASQLDIANRFGQLVYDALLALPPATSTPVQGFSADLAEELQTLRAVSDLHKVIGGREGAIVVSQTSEPVDFARSLNDRVANLVPVDDLEIPVRSVTAFTQTIGIYPDGLKDEICDRLILHGAQRIVSLGYACQSAWAGPHDGMEPLRRMLKWVTNETNDPAVVPLASKAA